jgi:UDP-N-acetylglucosamine 4,6-dehydratase/5-epimerase
MLTDDVVDKAVAGRSVLVTGGTGSFGRHCIDTLLRRTHASRIVVLSRDELKQFQMEQHYGNEPRLRFFLGDVRDRDRLYRAFDGVDIVVHAAALKQIPAAEYNPFEFVKTNVLGAQNIIDAAIDRGVKKVVALSTDKASSPVNLYGATKLVSDRLFVAGNSYAGHKPTRFSIVRYGNVVGSRGSVVWKLRQLEPGGVFHLTDERMTRFWITLDQAVNFVMSALHEMRGGEIFVPKLPSMKLTDLVAALAPSAKVHPIGIRPGEKLHEEMISTDEARRAVDRGDHYVVLPDIIWANQSWAEGQPVADGFRYASDSNTQWLDKADLAALLDD